MADFVPCDRLLQKAYSFLNVIARKIHDKVLKKKVVVSPQIRSREYPNLIHSKNTDRKRRKNKEKQNIILHQVQQIFGSLQSVDSAIHCDTTQ